MLRITREQARAIDRIAIERFGIPGIVLMENAARAATDVAIRMLSQRHLQRVMILCGGGNNGGDGLAIARHLSIHGINITVRLCVDPSALRGDAKINHDILRAMKIPLPPVDLTELAGLQDSLLIDAIFGTGLQSAPRAPFPSLVEAIGQSHPPVLAIDIPSGLDCDTGLPLGACLKADETITFVAEKTGFATPAAGDFLGRISIGHIGIPSSMIEQALHETTRA